MALYSDSIFVLAKEDAPALASLEKICFSTGWDADMYAKFLPAGRSALQDFAVKDLPELLITGMVGAKNADGEASVLAYLSLRLVKSIGQAEIFNIAVQPQLRGQGVAGLLLGRVLRFLKERNYVEFLLEVRESNTPARALYARQGFSVCGQRPRYYPDGEDALLMQLVCENTAT